MLQLLTMLAAAIPSVIGAMLAFFTRKVATAAGSLTTFGILTVAFVAAINAAFAQVSGGFTAPTWIANALGMFIPANFGVCLAALVSAKIARGAYDLARAKLSLVNGAS